jgi:hypothetical protein
MYWIDRLKSRFPNGHNLTDGGKGINGYVMSDEIKKKHRIASTGKRHSEETKQRMSKYWTENSPYRGKKFSDEHRKNMSTSKKGIPKPDGFGERVSKTQGKGVLMMNKNSNEVLNYFHSTYKAAEWIRENTNYEKANYSKIAKVCRGIGSTVYGFKWDYKIKEE